MIRAEIQFENRKELSTMVKSLRGSTLKSTNEHSYRCTSRFSHRNEKGQTGIPISAYTASVRIVPLPSGSPPCWPYRPPTLHLILQLERIRVWMGAKRVAKEGLEVALALLRLASVATDVFPPLKSAAGGALHIAELVSKFHSSKQEWADFADHIVAALACVIESLLESKEPREDLLHNVQSLADALVRIQKEITSLQQKSGLSRAWKFVKDPEKIVGMRKELDDVLSLFHLRAALTTGLDVAKLPDLANIQQLLEGVNRKLGETIVSAINLSAIPYAEGASWDSNPNSICLSDTRVDLLHDIMSWIESGDQCGQQRVLWLSSVAGGGKTAVANTVAKLCHEKSILAASFFFDRQTAGRNDPKRLFNTLARGLASYSREIATKIDLAIEEDSTVVTAPIFRQFEELILAPSMRYSGNKPIVAILDGLDEGSDSELLYIVRDEFPKLPGCFRILMTSRPEPEIVTFLSQRPHIRRVNIDIRGQSNLEDVDLYAHHQLREIRTLRSLAEDWPSAELSKEFTSKAGGLFIWVTVVSRYLRRVSYADKKLVTLLSKSGGQSLTAEEQMDQIYSTILEGCDWKDADYEEGYNLIIGAIVVAKTPLSISALQSLHRCTPIQVMEILRPLGALISSDLSDETQPVHILHLSLQEFLTSPTQPSRPRRRFELSHKAHNRRLAHLCLAILNDDLPLDIPSAGFLQNSTPESQVKGIPDMNNVEVPEVLWYACRFWLDHLIEVDEPDQETFDQLHKFLSMQLVPWLEIAAGKAQFQTLNCLREWLQKVVPNQSNLLELISSSSVASVFDDLSDRFQHMVRREDALNAIEYAVALHRLLAAANPEAFNPKLATSLGNFSNCLSELGQREEALRAIEQALDLHRQLAAGRPATFNSGLACSIINLSCRLSELGRREEALAATEQAVALCRQLAADHPATFNPDLAISLNNFSYCLSNLGRQEEALGAIEHAVTLYRQLAADHPVTFNSDLAMSLNNFSNHLSDLGRHEEALGAIEQAVALYRQLAADHPAAFNPDLAMSLNNFSNHLSDLGRQEEALGTIEEAVALRRQLAADHPAAFNSGLAMSFNNFSSCLSDLGRQEEALGAIEEAVALYRQLAADHPATFNPDLAMSLYTLSSCLSDRGRQEEALAAIEQAVALHLQLAAERPETFNPNLAMSLNNLSRLLFYLGRQEAALEASEQSVALRRQLAADRPAAYNHRLARSLDSLSRCLYGLGREEEAREAKAEAELLTPDKK